MTDLPPSRTLVSILPVNDLDAAERFYGRLGFFRRGPGEQPAQATYRMLWNAEGCHLHLAKAPPGWVVPDRNPVGVYIYRDDIDAVAAAFAGEIIEGKPEHKSWGMYEFALSDPDGTLVRVGWPSPGGAD
jgi:predicted enzyme related to lactoylglutathione lyase